MIPILLIAGLIFVVIKTTIVLSDRNSWSLEYQSVGERYLGKKSASMGVTTMTPFSRPTLTFKYRDTHATLSSHSSRGFPDHRRETRLSLILPFEIVEMEMTTAELTNWRWKTDRLKKIVFDDPEFQATFKAASSNPFEAKRQINSAIQWQLEQLRRAGKHRQVRMKLSERWLEVSVPSDLRNCQPIDDFVRMSLKLYDLLAMQETKGLNFVNEDSVTLLESVKCPICSVEIETKTVCCIRCQTPHCYDCWEYNGECATFACNETRFTEVGNSGAEAHRHSL